jgi:putative transposase
MPLETRRIQQAFKFALALTPAQERLCMSHAGGARFAYNWGLDQIGQALDAYAAEKAELEAAGSTDKPTTSIPRHFDLCRMWTAHKDANPQDLHWVGENFVGTYQAALRDAAGAWKAFFDSRAGRRAGRRVGRPRFKSRRKARPAFQVHGQTLQVTDVRHVRLPKIGEVRTAEKTRKLLRLLRKGDVECVDCRGGLVPLTNAKGERIKCKACKGTGLMPHTRLVRASITQVPSGRWFVSLTVETHRDVRTAPSQRQRDGGTIGVDIGVRDIATLSDGTVIENPRHLDKALRKLARAQQDLSRCQDTSNRRVRARKRVARIHARVADLRRDGLSQTASQLVHGHQRIIVEGWDIAETLASGSSDLPQKVRRNRNRALASVGLGEFRWMIESRASWYGPTVVVADRHQETGRTCAACGTVRDKPVPPAENKFHCLTCGHTTDRRLNTAQALVHWDRAQTDAQSSGESQNGRGGNVRPGTSRRTGQSPTKRQASTQHHRDQTGTPDP